MGIIMVAKYYVLFFHLWLPLFTESQRLHWPKVMQSFPYEVWRSRWHQHVNEICLITVCFVCYSNMRWQWSLQFPCGRESANCVGSEKFQLAYPVAVCCLHHLLQNPSTECWFWHQFNSLISFQSKKKLTKPPRIQKTKKSGNSHLDFRECKTQRLRKLRRMQLILRRVGYLSSLRKIAKEIID